MYILFYYLLYLVSLPIIIENELAQSLQREGNDEEARKVYESALSQVTTRNSNNQVIIFHIENSLGLLLSKLQVYPDAEKYLMSAYNSYKTLYGQQNISTLTAISNLASLYEKMARYEVAEPLCEECLEGFNTLLGE